MNRAERISKNARFAVAGELLLALLKFISRRVFLVILGREYLGLSGLFTDVLSMLSLAEMGFSVSITYSLYGPAAKGDTETVKSLISLYRRVYRAMGFVVLAAGLALTPFLGFFVKEMPEDIPHIPFIYILNLVNACIPYFFSYGSTMLFVHQKKYIETAIRAAVSLGAAAAQIGVLFLTGNYLYYLYIAIAATVVQNAAVYLKTERLYPYLREKNVRPLPKEARGEIKRNVKAMLLHRIGAVAVFNTDNLLISRFVGIAAAGLYSNYMMIRGFLNILINALFDAVTPAMGNLSATEPQEHRRGAFRLLNFFSAWLFGWMSICLFCLYDPFIDIWLGRGYLLPKPAVLLIAVNFYIASMRIPLNSTKSVLGLFWEDRYKSLAEAVLNLGISVILARSLGITGIIAGTLLSTLAVPFWCEPMVLYRRGLQMPLRHYFAGYLAHSAVTLGAGALTWRLCGAIGQEGIAAFLLKCLLCLVIPNIIYLAVYRRREELALLIAAVMRILHRT